MTDDMYRKIIEFLKSSSLYASMTNWSVIMESLIYNRVWRDIPRFDTPMSIYYSNQIQIRQGSKNIIDGETVNDL